MSGFDTSSDSQYSHVVSRKKTFGSEYCFKIVREFLEGKFGAKGIVERRQQRGVQVIYKWVN